MKIKPTLLSHHNLEDVNNVYLVEGTVSGTNSFTTWKVGTFTNLHMANEWVKKAEDWISALPEGEEIPDFPMDEELIDVCSQFNIILSIRYEIFTVKNMECKNKGEIQ